MRTLYTRLVGGLLVLLVAIGGLVLALSVYNARYYRVEVTQALHANLAENLVEESLLMSDGRIDPGAVEGVFHTLMVINPTIEVYLLDADGALLRYSAPEGKVKLAAVDLAPVEAFLSPSRRLPILGDDPRNPGKRKVFSVAPIVAHGETQGYLYVILESEEYASAADAVWSSSVMRVSATALVATLLFALSAGGLIFYFLTRRLRALDASVGAFREGSFETPIADDGRGGDANARDEIDRLAESFRRMSLRIAEQMHALRATDTERRQLIANVSHDLRTPLASLKGYLDTLLLKDANLSDEERRQYLEIASRSSDRLERLIDDLFELAKLEATETRLDPEEFSLPELVHDVLRKFELEAKEKGVALDVDVENEIPFVVGEIALIERVLENLIRNALYHTPTGGSISARISAREGQVHVRISDTGEGIAPADLPHIFGRFYRVASDGAEAVGTGLGLAISKRILDLHASTIEVTSQLGVGTTFDFDLPAAAAPQGA